MNKIFSVMITGTIMLTACGQAANNSSKSTEGKVKTKATCKYTCIMHKDICSAKPGVCPKCGMQLVEKEQ